MKTAAARLFRLRLALLNGVSAATGCLLFPGPVRYSALAALFCGVSLLAAGASAANQVLERDFDRLMARTRHRPLPRGELSVRSATVIAGCTVTAGTLLLGAAGGFLPVLLGWGVLLTYLACYTPLKRRSAFALLPGALCGAAPPVIGWGTAGGDPTDYRIVLLAGLFYLWQMPHFWLLLRRHQEEYRQAGFALVAPFSNTATPVTAGVVWTAALAVSVLMLPLFGLVTLQVAPWCVALSAAVAAVSFFPSHSPRYTCLNLFPLLVALVLLASR